MAISVSFFLVYSKKKIAAERLQEYPISVRAQVRYTRSHLNWSSAKRLGHTVERIQFTTPVQAQPRWWIGGRAKHNHPNAPTINATLDAISERAVSLHAAYIAADQFPTQKEYIAAMLGASETPAAPATLPDYYHQYVEYLADRNTGQTTIKRHRYIIEILKRFQKETAYRLEFNTINKTFAAKFMAWAIRALPTRRESQNIDNTVQRYFKDLRNFLNHAHTEGWTTVVTWRQIKPRLRHNAFPVTVSQEEIARLSAITAADFSARYRQSAENILLTRDWFIIGTQTALRWSDWRNRQFKFIPIGPDAYDLQFIQEKTDEPLQIPLSTIALDILRRHNFQMPRVFSPAATMSHLRILAAAAGIAKHITSHTARRTFCTLQEAAGVPRSIIMRITGHHTEKDYLRYTGITFRYNADLMRRANPAMFKTAG